MKLLTLVCFFTLLFLSTGIFCGHSMHAQSATAKILGQVTDPQDASVAPNHVKFQNPDTNIADQGATLGKVLATYPARIIQFAGRINF